MKKFCDKYSLLAVAMAALMLLASCSKLSTSLRSNTIRVSVETSDTKGTVTTSANLPVAGAFVMNAYVDGDVKDSDTGATIQSAGEYIVSSNVGNVQLNAGEWKIANDPKWVYDVNTRFWCWHPIEVATRSINTIGTEDESISFTYTTPAVNGTTDADNQKDLLFAYTKQKYDGSNDVVNIKFYHALSQIRFCVSPGDNGDGTYDKNLIIKNITISGLKNYGACTFSGDGIGSGSFTWSGQTGDVSYGQDYNASFAGGTPESWTSGSFTSSGHSYNLCTCSNVFFLVPQELDKNNAEITVTFEADGKTLSPVTRKLVAASASQTDEWLPGKYYTYKLNATIVERSVALTVTLEDWSERDDKIFI